MPRVRTVGDRVSSRDSFSVWEFLRKRESKILKRRTWATCKLRKAKRQGYHIRFAYGDIVGPFWLLDIYISHPRCQLWSPRASYCTACQCDVMHSIWFFLEDAILSMEEELKNALTRRWSVVDVVIVKQLNYQVQHNS